MTKLPQGYEPHEIPGDYTGPLFIEGQMRRFAEAETVRLRKAARMALKNLDGISNWLQNTGNDHLCDEYAATLDAIDALREALGSDK